MNITKSLYLALCISMGGFVFAACDDDRNEVRYETLVVPEKIFAEGLTFAPVGDTYTFHVQSKSIIRAHAERIDEDGEDDLKWITVEVGDNTPDGYPVTVTTEKNENRKARQARISVYATNTARAFTLTQPTSAPVVADETPINDVSATELAKRIFAGVNIGNTLEAPEGEGAWSQRVTIEYIRGLKAAGFNAVRIPCAWDSHVDGKTPNEKKKNIINAGWLERVDEIVQWVIGEDMYAIVNIHWDGGWLEESCVKGYDAAVDKKQRDYWTQIAKKLNHYDEHLLFAGMNEPGQQDQGGVNSGSIDAIKAYQQTFVDAVRATGGNNATRCLIHQTPYTNIDRGVSSNYDLPSDPAADRALVEVHFYDPSDFTIMDKDGAWGIDKIKLYWGAANHVAGSDRNCTGGEESHVDSEFAKVQKHFVSKGIPVIVGEYGVDAGRNIAGMDVEKHKASRAYWTEYVTMSAKNHGCVPFYWETGSDINRSSGALTNAYLFNALMNGAANGSYPF